MRITRVLPALCLGLGLASLPTSSAATGYVSTNCTGTTVEVSLSIFNDLAPGVAGRPIIIHQGQVGTCVEPVVHVLAGIVMPAHMTLLETTLTLDAPQADLFYTYRISILMDDGTEQALYPGYHASGCGTASGGRGYLTSGDVYLTFLSCGGTCWEGVLRDGDGVDGTALSPEDLLLYVDTGIPVDVFGSGPWAYPMPGAPAMVLTAVAPVPGGDCDAIGIHGATWGGLKARYR